MKFLTQHQEVVNFISVMERLFAGRKYIPFDTKSNDKNMYTLEVRGIKFFCGAGLVDNNSVSEGIYCCRVITPSSKATANTYWCDDVFLRSWYKRDEDKIQLNNLVESFMHRNAFYADLAPKEDILTDNEVIYMFLDKLNVDLKYHM